MKEEHLTTDVTRRAILIFADQTAADLSRRGLPQAATPLLALPVAKAGGCAGVDVHVFTRGLERDVAGAQVHAQAGKDFAERFENAIATVSALGYDEVVAIGRDCPSLRSADLELAFAQLHDHRLVLGPDHRGGCYLIGFRARDRHLLLGVRWKQNTDRAQLLGRCRGANVFLLPVQHDLDSWADVRIVAQGGDWIAKFASFLIQSVCTAGDRASRFVDLALQFVRVRGQMPPPAFAG